MDRYGLRKPFASMQTLSQTSRSSGQSKFNLGQSWKTVHTSFVHAIVHRMIDPFVHGLNFFLQVRWKQAATWLVDFSAPRRQEVVKSRVEHPDDFAALIANNSFLLLIPEAWNRVWCWSACLPTRLASQA